MTKSVFTDKYKRFRLLLIKARHQQGLSQTAVAKKLKRLQAYVSKYERGERRLDLIEFLDIARVLSFDACEFIKQLEQSTKAKKKVTKAKTVSK